MSGKIQGEKNERIPARKTEIKNKKLVAISKTSLSISDSSIK